MENRKITGRNKTLNLDIICVVLVMMTGVVRLVRDYAPAYSSNIPIFLFFVTALFIWMNQVRRRLIHPAERRLVLGVAVLILILMITRTVKFAFLMEDSLYARYAWYLYYVPQTLAVLWMFYAVLYIGKSYDYQPGRRWKLLYIPAFVLIFGIMTNDLHQLAFAFPDGMENWDASYTRGPFYIFAIVWMAVLFLAILAVAFSRCAVSQNRQRIWIPMIPLGIGILYTVLYILKPDGLFASLYKMAEMICFIFPAFMECLILAHLFPSNDSYMDLWAVSSTGGGLMDERGHCMYSADVHRTVTKEQVLDAQRQAVLLPDQKTLLRSHKVSGGYGFWFKDISDILELNKNLADMGDVLAEENAMLEGEIQLSRKRVQVEEKSQLYNEIARRVSPKLVELKQILDSSKNDSEESLKNLRYGGILNVYIKRCSNLLILSRQQGIVSCEELWLAISESLEYMRLYGIKAYGERTGTGRLYGLEAILIYETFEGIIESVIPNVKALLVTLKAGEQIELRIEMDIYENVPDKLENTSKKQIDDSDRWKCVPDYQKIRGEFEKYKGTYEWFEEGDTRYFTATLPAYGGDGNDRK